MSVWSVAAPLSRNLSYEPSPSLSFDVNSESGMGQHVSIGELCSKEPGYETKADDFTRFAEFELTSRRMGNIDRDTGEPLVFTGFI